MANLKDTIILGNLTTTGEISACAVKVPGILKVDSIEPIVESGKVNLTGIKFGGNASSLDSVKKILLQDPKTGVISIGGSIEDYAIKDEVQPLNNLLSGISGATLTEGFLHCSGTNNNWMIRNDVVTGEYENGVLTLTIP